MLKKISLATLLVLSNTCSATDYVELINSSNYSDLKYALYKEQPDVLDRSGGFSILDYAIAKKNQRAAIIVADYNNRSINERRLSLIEIELNRLSIELNNNTSNPLIQKEINKLQNERDLLKKEINKDTIKHVDSKLDKISPSINELTNKVAQLEKLTKSNEENDIILNKINDLEASIASSRSEQIAQDKSSLALEKAKNERFAEEIELLKSKLNKLEIERDGDVIQLEDRLNINVDTNIKETKEYLERIQNEINILKKRSADNDARIKEETSKLASELLALKNNELSKEEISIIVDNLYNTLEKRVKSLEGQVLPIDVKNATFESRNIFSEEIKLDNS